MVTSAQALKKYGDPNKQSAMIMWDVPGYLEIGVIPKKIYCNKDMIKPLAAAFQALITTNHVKELKTWDGCFNIRKKRGLTSMSLHSWGLAIDLNAFENGLNMPSKLSPGFVKCFTDNGFTWGGLWQRKDPMHFQLAEI